MCSIFEGNKRTTTIRLQENIACSAGKFFHWHNIEKPIYSLDWILFSLNCHNRIVVTVVNKMAINYLKHVFIKFFKN